MAMTPSRVRVIICVKLKAKVVVTVPCCSISVIVTVPCCSISVIVTVPCSNASVIVTVICCNTSTPDLQRSTTICYSSIQYLATVAGISISGGRDSHAQPQVKVQKVFPGGAAHIEGTIRVSGLFEIYNGDF